MVLCSAHLVSRTAGDAHEVSALSCIRWEHPHKGCTPATVASILLYAPAPIEHPVMHSFTRDLSSHVINIRLGNQIYIVRRLSLISMQPSKFAGEKLN